MSKIHAVGFALIAVFAFCAITASSAFAEGEWLANGKSITTALVSDETGTLHLIALKTASGAVLNELECSGLFEGTLGPHGAGTITDLYNLSGEVIGILGDTNVTALACAVTQSAGEIGDCLMGAVASVWATNVSLELGSAWSLEVVLMGILPMTYLLVYPANAGYEVLCATVLGELEDKCEGATSATLENAESEKGVLDDYTSESEADNCSLTGEKTGTYSGSELLTLTDGETLTVSE